MKLTNWLHVNAVLPAFQRERCSSLGSRLLRLAKEEKRSLQENSDLQWQRLQALLQHAYESTAFYRTRMSSAGLHPKDIRSPEDLTRIPVLTRDHIRQNLEGLCSSSYKKEDLRTSATGGTTDTPVTLKRDVESLRKKTAAQIRFNTWAGMWPGDKTFHLWGARSDYVENPSWRWRLYDQGLMRNFWAPTSLINTEVLELYREQLNRFKPDVLYAYPTPLALFCEQLQRSGKSFHRSRTVVCTAEALLPEQRNLIEETLGCSVFEHYGSREFGMIAAECELHSGLHLNTSLCYVEYVPVGGAQEERLHEILITDLTNYGMPLIRYRVNDCVVLADSQRICPCGRGYPLMEKIIGRTSDVLTLPDGSKVPGISLTNRVLQVCPGLRKIQVVQETLMDFRIRYVPGENFDDKSIHLLQTNLRKFFPSDLRWEFQAVSEIERERSGKTRFCVSKFIDKTPSQTPPAETETLLHSGSRS